MKDIVQWTQSRRSVSRDCHILQLSPDNATRLNCSNSYLPAAFLCRTLQIWLLGNCHPNHWNKRKQFATLGHKHQSSGRKETEMFYLVKTYCLCQSIFFPTEHQFILSCLHKSNLLPKSRRLSLPLWHVPHQRNNVSHKLDRPMLKWIQF